MNELLKMILSLSLSGSLLIFVLLLCKPLMKDKLSKRWQYYIWLIVIARLVLPFAPETNLMRALFQHFDSTVIQTNENQQTGQSTPLLFPVDSADHGAQDIGAVCMSVWLIGAVALLIRKITIYQSFVTYIKAGRLEVSDLALWEQVGELVQQTGVKETVGIYTNSLISSPLLVGFFHPSIMLPTAQLSNSNFQYTILHELTHCKRRDMFYKWLVQFTVCLHWFNPLVYLMSGEINRICELSCDEAVIRTLDIDGRRAYGDTLLHALETGGSYKNSLASVTLSESKERLKERLEAIMNFKKKTLLTATISTSLTLALCFGASAAGAYTVTPQINQSKDAASGSTIIDLSSDGRGSITQSGSFEAEENQTLILTVQSNIQGGAVDLVLFSPSGKEQRVTFNGWDKTELIALSTGRWDYNCTGFFTSGDIAILGKLNGDTITTPQLPDQSNEKAISNSTIISLSSDGRGNITQSGSFEARENQTLILTVQSNIQEGTVDLFLFSPDGREQRITFNGTDKTESISLSSGRWNYNCTGFFKSGDITILGELKKE